MGLSVSVKTEKDCTNWALWIASAISVASPNLMQISKLFSCGAAFARGFAAWPAQLR